MNPMLDAALSYAARGWGVFPVQGIFNGRCTCGGADCSAGKHPIHGGGFKVATTDAQTIRDWWEAHPHANVAIATGAVSGLLVIDIDDGVGKAGSQSLAALEAENEPLPVTFAVRTGSGGRHLYFRMPDAQIRSSAGKLGENLDVRADGGYVVAPPSAHISGGSYVCENDAALADAPAWLVAKLTDQARAGRRAALTFQNGNRHVDFLATSLTLRNRGMEEAMIQGALTGLNGTIANPVSDEELEGIASWAGKADVRVMLDDMSLSRHVARTIRPYCRFAAGLGWLHFDGMRWRADDKNFALEQVKRQLERVYASFAARGNPHDLELAKPLRTASKVLNVFKLLASDDAIRCRAEDFDAPSNLFNLLNGTLDLSTGEFRPHDPDDLLTKVAGADYDPEASCPTFDRFLGQVLEEDVQAFMMRLFGYALLGDPKHQKFVILHGPGGNGKSTLMATIGDVFGDYAMTAEPSTFIKPKGAQIREDLARLAGARMVLTSELASGEILDAALMKRLTGGEKMTARLLHQNSFEYLPKFVGFMTTNALPVIDGGDEGLKRRLVIVPLEKSIQESDRDVNLQRKLRAELPGIFNRILAGFADYRRDQLSVPEVIEKATATYVESSDLIGSFLEDECDFGEGFRVAAMSMYSRYVSWCSRNGFKSLSMRLFKMELEKKGLKQKQSNASRVWLDVRVRSGGGTM